VTPDQRHTGADVALLAGRAALYAAAKAKNPKRWTMETREWSRVEEVALVRRGHAVGPVRVHRLRVQE